MARRNQDFQTIRSEGGLLPLDLLRRVLDPRSGISGNAPEDYGLPAGERLNEAITQSWNRLRKHWVEFSEVAESLPDGTAGTHLTNNKWSLPLLRELGFGFLPVTAGPELDGRTFPIGRFFGPVPIHLVGCGLSLDRRAAGQRGAASANPHGMVQEFLNRSGAHLWAIVSNGLNLRVLRDSQALSRQSYLEFDLKATFSGEVYSDFVLLWLMVHATRFVPRDGDRRETCLLEQWTQEAERLGTRALGELRGGVERALAILGAGFAGHPKNNALREALRSGTLSPAGLHEQLLRVVYRLIFLFVAEDRTLDGRSLLHPPDDSEAARIARERYAQHYGTARLRRMAGSIKGSRHGDLWFQFRSLVAPLSGDPAAAEARRHLALPALGSFLWDPASTTALNETELTNFDFLEALRHLAYTRQNKVLRPVDYHNLGAEELGGVYESLLALTPQVNGAGGFSFAEFTGNRRKTSGSYYTPDPLVQCLLDSALDPVVEAAVGDKAGTEAERAILDLKVCDPAVGSGHFLVGAAHRLARHLARIRAYGAGESEPSPLLYQRALRNVIGRCLYGVDVNPMAAELCRVGLWLEALEPGKPLSFLDRHIRVGNSLLGATPDSIEAGLPDAAFRPIQGDDKTVCSELRKRNKNEREYGQRDMGFVAESGEEYDSLTSRSRSIDHGPDDILAEVHTKEAQFRRLQESADYRDAQQVADAWLAAFVWPKRPGVVDAPTTDTLRRLREGAEALAPPQRKELERMAGRYQFFHWHLAFPEVFAAGGFDCVLGNPPWERVKLVEKEWFAERRSEIANAPNAAARKRMIDELQHRLPELHAGFAAALRKSNGTSRLLRDSGRYPLCGRGDINLYAVFAEAMRSIVNERGRAGCVLPTGVATDDTTKLFFQDVVDSRSLVSLFDFENRRGLFPDVDSRMKFCLFTAGSGATPASERAEFVFFAHAVDELLDSERRFTLSPDEIALVNPNTRTCPIFRSRKDAELTKAIYRRVPVLVHDARDSAANRSPWGVQLSTMYHMTNDASSFASREELDSAGWQLDGNVFRKGGRKYLPLYEGRFGHQFNHRFASHGGGESTSLSAVDTHDPRAFVEPQYWIDGDDVDQRLSRRTVDCQTGMLAFRRVARNTDERTCISAIIPWGAASYGWILLLGPEANALLFLGGILNCYAFDYLLRGALTQPSIPQGTVSQIPFLTPESLESTCPWDETDGLDKWINRRVMELVYTAYDLQPMAKDVGRSHPPFLWDEERRFLLRCELDGAFFHRYMPADQRGHWQAPRRFDGIHHVETAKQLAELSGDFPTPRDAVEYIMDTFPIVRRKDEGRYGEYRTKRVILEVYDAMQIAAATGEPYLTVLDPPPADRTCCHPTRIAVVDLASLADGEWARQAGEQIAAETVVLAAVLKANGGPALIRTVRLTALLAIEPRLLTPSLSPAEGSQWQRVVGAEAVPLDSGTIPFLPSANFAWGSAVRQLRGSGRLIEDVAARTWAPGSGVDEIHTEGWPEGRVGIVMQALRRRDSEEVVRTLPDNVRDWINAEAA